jgi:hypothetical protein
MKIVLLTALLLSFSFGKIVTIVDNGVKRKLFIPEPKINARAIDSKKVKKELIISFAEKIDINDFEERYNLKLKRKIGSKYYIFKNNSNLDDITLMQEIIENNTSIIKTIRPNWGFSFQAR